MIAALAVALAAPGVVRLPSSRSAIVYLVDVSHSVSGAPWIGRSPAIDAMNANVRPDELRILVFGRKVASVVDTVEVRRLAIGRGPRRVRSVAWMATAPTSSRRWPQPAPRSRRASNGRIVLFSDGRETEGDGRTMADRLAAEHVPVFTNPMPVRNLGDVWIQAIRVPRTPVAQGTTVEVVMGSQTNGAG